MPKVTSLVQVHRESGGRIVEFAGFLMPLQFSGVVDEHRTVREAAGLFDVSHMGQIVLRGDGAVAAADRLVTNRVDRLEDGQILYTPICYPDGGIVDDCLVYRMAPDHVLFVVNASNMEKDFQWIAEQTGDRCEVTDESDDHALLALQGPAAVEILAGIAGEAVKQAPAFTFLRLEIDGIACVASRTGYTGEDGFEISCSPEHAVALWRGLMDAGAKHGVKPCGLGARDTLRLEARLCLYGNDIDETTSPLEAGLGWTVKLRGDDFIGKPALRAQKKQGVQRKLVCLQMTSRGIARHGHAICERRPDGTPGPAVGRVTSGTKSPTLGQAVALGYVPAALAEPGAKLAVDVRGKAVQAEVIKGPFYKRP